MHNNYINQTFGQIVQPYKQAQQTCLSQSLSEKPQLDFLPTSCSPRWSKWDFVYYASTDEKKKKTITLNKKKIVQMLEMHYNNYKCYDLVPGIVRCGRGYDHRGAMFISLIRKTQNLSMINLKLKANRLSNILMLHGITTRRKQIKVKELLISWPLLISWLVFIWYT